jgi:glycosyltransferase involved in cell wall biosynthesis
MRLLHLYRPRLPGLRAQAIQVLHACHALAERGWRVTLLADSEGVTDPLAALAAFGLDRPPGLDLRLAPTMHPGLAGLWFRSQVARWALGGAGVVLARDKRRLAGLLPYLPRRHRLVLESHELDSALDEEAGRDPGETARLEALVVGRADALIANCGGTLRLWEERHAASLPGLRRTIHNGTAASRRRDRSAEPDPVLRVLGSLRAYKGVDALLEAAPLLPLPLEFVGGTDSERAARSPPPNVRLSPPVPYPAVPDLLARSAALILPLQDNLFGRQLTSPLKLWDYLATSAPVIAPDLPTVREIAAMVGGGLHLHRPDDPNDLARATREAIASGCRTPFLRTWQDRAAEVDDLLMRLPALARR